VIGPARRTVAVVAAAFVALLVCGFSAAASPTSSTSQTAADASPIRVVITTLTPVSIGPDDTITVAGTLTNTGSEPLDDLSFTVGVGPRIDSRAALTTDLAHAPGLSHLLNFTAQSNPMSLAPGGQAPFALTIPVHGSALDTSRPTVYPFQVRIDSGRRTDLGQADTFLPFFPNAVSSPLRVAWVWPLDSAPAVSATGQISDPDVPATFAPGGRLRAILDLAQKPAAATAYAPITFAVDPSLLTTVQTVTHNGWTRSGDKTSGDGRTASADAASWLAELKTLTRGQDVIALPYADPDAVALVRAGLGSDLATSIALGRSELSTALPEAQFPSIAWPANGAVDQATLDAYAAAGSTAVIVDGNQIPASPAADLTTQSAPTELDTRGPDIRGLAADSEARSLLAGNGKDSPSPQMAVQRVLALLAVAVGERPNGTSARDMVLTMPRDLDPNAAWAQALLRDTATLPWLQPVTLTQVATDPSGQRTGLQAYPSTARSAELPQSSLVGAPTSVTTLRQQIADVRGMLPDRTLTRPLDDALSRAESVAWRTKTTAGSQQALLDQVQQQANALLGGVTLAVTGQVTLTSKNGNVPITVRNTLPEPVTVEIALSTADRTKLTSPGPRKYVIQPGAKQRVLLPAKTQRAGTFRVDLNVTTPDGRRIATAPLTVHSTAYGTITLVITLAALGVLVLAIARRLFIRIRGWRSGARVPGPSATA
jgi:hypothetical protein